VKRATLLLLVLLLGYGAGSIGAQTQPVGGGLSPFGLSGAVATLLAPFTSLQIAAAGFFGWTGRSQIQSGSDGVITMTPSNTGSQLSSLNFGTSANMPVLTTGVASAITLNNVSNANVVFAPGVNTFAVLNLVLLVNGQMTWCSDCNPNAGTMGACAGGSTGAFAYRINSALRCVG